MSFLKMRAVPYYPEIGNLTGSVSSAILMTQLEYWFDKMNNKPFYKFLEACNNESYKKGESWTEELSISKEEFRTAFSKIGVTYKTKKEFDASEDKFKGKFYCSYIDRLKRQTFYIRNNELITTTLNNIFKEKEDIECDIKTTIYRNKESQSLEIGNPNIYKLGNPISRNGDSQSPYTGDYLQQNTTKEYQQQTEKKIVVESNLEKKWEEYTKEEQEKALKLVGANPRNKIAVALTILRKGFEEEKAINTKKFENGIYIKKGLTAEDYLNSLSAKEEQEIKETHNIKIPSNFSEFINKKPVGLIQEKSREEILEQMESFKNRR